MKKLSPAALESIAENMKERIYATITLLAVIAVLWQTADRHSALGALASMGGTLVALWLATLIAARMSHHAVHGRNMTVRELKRLMFTSSGLFAPAIIPALFVLLSLVKVIDLKSAFLAGIVALLLSLFLLSFYAGRRIHTNLLQLLLISTVEMLVGVGVVAIKVLVGE